MQQQENEWTKKARLIVEVYCNSSGVPYAEHTQELESMICVALKEMRDEHKPAYTWPRRYG